MAANVNTINASVLRRPSDRAFYLAAALLFPALVFVGYFKSYYFRPFFTDEQFGSWLVHAHGIVMSAWVLYFSAQVALIRTKNIKLHMTMGFAGIALAALVVVIGMGTAYSAHLVRHTAPPGMDPYAFFLIPVTDMLYFIGFFAGAIYYRKRPAEHKSLMLMTAINFMPPALGRLAVVPPDYMILWAFGIPAATAIGCLIWNARKHGKLNRVFATAVFLFIALFPLRLYISSTETWHNMVGAIAP